MFTWTREYRWLQPRLAPSILHCNPPLSWPPAPAAPRNTASQGLLHSVQVINSVASSQDGHLSINIGVFLWHWSQSLLSTSRLSGSSPRAGGGWPAWLFMSCSLTPALAPLLCKPSHFPPTWPCSKNHPLWEKNLTQQKQERHQHQFDYPDPEGILIARYQTAMSVLLGAGPCPWSKVIICLRFKIPFIKFFCVYSQNLFGLFLHSA